MLFPVAHLSGSREKCTDNNGERIHQWYLLERENRAAEVLGGGIPAALQALGLIVEHVWGLAGCLER